MHEFPALPMLVGTGKKFADIFQATMGPKYLKMWDYAAGDVTDIDSELVMN